MDVIFVIDASGIVGLINYKVVLNFVSQVIGRFDIDSGQVRVGVVVFGSTARVAFHLGRYSTALDVRAAVSQIDLVGGQTYTQPAFEAVRKWMFQPQNGSRDSARHVVLLIADGNTVDTEEATVEVQLVCCVLIGDTSHRTEQRLETDVIMSPLVNCDTNFMFIRPRTKLSYRCKGTHGDPRLNIERVRLLHMRTWV